MYEIFVNDASYTIPKANIVPFAMYKSMQMGIMSGPIHDEKSAIEYLETLGMTIKERTQA